MKEDFPLEHTTQDEVDRAGHADPTKGFNMSGNTDKAAGMANEDAGKIKQGVGKAVGSDKMQSEGAGQKAKGDAQQLKGDAKNAVKNAVHKVADAANKKL
jgi:uncharacterized protein YjbJ (UPF0337 family)